MSGPGAHDKDKRTGGPPKHQKDMHTTGIMGSNAQLRNRITGYTAGIIAGISYGMNPLFGKELLAGGAPVSSVLFFRYLFATIFMAVLMMAKRESFATDRSQRLTLLILGVLFSCSSLFLFDAYNYIPAGLATTVVYLYPVFTALIMLFLKVKPSRQVWISIMATLVGVFILMDPLKSAAFNLTGAILAGLSALSYAGYLVIVNQSGKMKNLSAHTITFYALATGTLIFLVQHLAEGGEFLQGISGKRDWLDLLGLGLVPTMVSLLALAMATKSIGPTKTAVLGVFEPITAIAIGTVAFGEPFTANVAVGAVICIGAIVFMILSGRQEAGKGQV